MSKYYDSGDRTTEMSLGLYR